MSKTYRGIFNNSMGDIEAVIDDLESRLSEIQDTLGTIEDDEISEDTLKKIGDIEYIIDSLLYELR